MHDATDSESNNQRDADIWQALGHLTPKTAPPEMTDGFREQLAREPRRRRIVRAPLLVALAATLALIAGAGWWHERQLRLTEEVKMQGELTSALQSLSTGTRLTAIDATVRDGRGGDAVEQALVTALLNDPSTNVRMAAAEALGRIARPATIRKAVTQALSGERSPFVQMSLLTATERLSGPDRRAAIAPLLTRGDVDPMVASDARDRVRDLSKGDSR